MARYIQSQRNDDSNHACDAFQVVVDVVADIPVGTSFVGSGIADNRKQIVTAVFRIFVKKHLHFFGPCYDKLLAGLVATIGEISVFEVGLFQKGHIDKTHSA